MNEDNIFVLNQVVFFVHGNQVVKGIIDELFFHVTQEKTIVKYAIRPFGLNDYVTVDECNTYKTLVEAKAVVVKQIRTKYVKADLIKSFIEAKEQLDKQYKDKIDNFESNLKAVEDNTNNISEKYFNKLEKAYQKKIKK